MEDGAQLVSLHAISCDCDQCLWYKVKKCLPYSDAAFRVGKLLGIRKDYVQRAGLDLTQHREAWFARLAEMRRDG